ncbi:hypothetical protein LMG919_12785 [Xanthomonas vesicatoria]|nr:hypothetical protein LMG919_12785 [Xanthomonas vesicatoria]
MASVIGQQSINANLFSNCIDPFCICGKLLKFFYSLINVLMSEHSINAAYNAFNQAKGSDNFSE